MRSGLFVAAAAAALLGACSEPPAVDLVARGKYLVNEIAKCGDCHTPMLASGEPDASHALQGSELGFQPLAEMPWAPYAPEIAGIPAGYTEESLAAFLQGGARPDGSHPLPPMPAYGMSSDDAKAVAAYVASLPKAP